MVILKNIYRAIKMYVSASVQLYSFHVVDGKFQPQSKENMKYALNKYEYAMYHWTYSGETWSERFLDKAHKHYVQKYQKYFKKYPMSEWDLSKVITQMPLSN